MPRPRKASTSSSRTRARMSSGSSIAILLISCEVRKPSKKWRNGIRARYVAACATSARSCASWTEPAASIAQPVVRACMTSLWSPKIERACVATVRAATWITAGVSSPAILNMFGIISRSPWRRRERRRKSALLERAVERAGGTRFGLHLDDVRDLAPQVRPLGRRPVVAVLRHRRCRGDRVDRDHLAQRVSDAGGGLVSVEAFIPMNHVTGSPGIALRDRIGARPWSARTGRSKHRRGPARFRRPKGNRISAIRPMTRSASGCVTRLAHACSHATKHGQTREDGPLPMAGSKLGDNPWRRIAATPTDRNWNTMTRLAARAAEE